MEVREFNFHDHQQLFDTLKEDKHEIRVVVSNGNDLEVRTLIMGCFLTSPLGLVLCTQSDSSIRDTTLPGFNKSVFKLRAEFSKTEGFYIQGVTPESLLIDIKESPMLDRRDIKVVVLNLALKDKEGLVSFLVGAIRLVQERRIEEGKPELKLVIALTASQTGELGAGDPGTILANTSHDVADSVPRGILSLSDIAFTSLLVRSFEYEYQASYLVNPGGEVAQEADEFLFELGALERDEQGILRITELGRQMCQFPMDVRLSWLMVNRDGGRHRREIVKLVAALYVFGKSKSLMLSEFMDKEFNSDHLALLNLYNQGMENSWNLDWCQRGGIKEDVDCNWLKHVNDFCIVKLQAMELQLTRVPAENHVSENLRRMVVKAFAHNCAKLTTRGFVPVNINGRRRSYTHDFNLLGRLSRCLPPRYVVFHHVLDDGTLNIVTEIDSIDCPGPHASRREELHEQHGGQILPKKKKNLGFPPFIIKRQKGEM